MGDAVGSCSIGQGFPLALFTLLRGPILDSLLDTEHTTDWFVFYGFERLGEDSRAVVEVAWNELDPIWPFR